MQPAEAELLYIKEVEKLDGFGQESFAAKVDILHITPNLLHTHIVYRVLCHDIYYSSIGQLHQRYFHWCVLHWGICEAQKWQIHHAPQVSCPTIFIHLWW